MGMGLGLDWAWWWMREVDVVGREGYVVATSLLDLDFGRLSLGGWRVLLVSFFAVIGIGASRLQKMQLGIIIMNMN